MACGPVRRGGARTGGRVALVALLATALLAVLAAPGHAHSRIAEYAGNTDSRITATPPNPDLRWRLHAGGSLVELEHLGDADVVVLGYDGEPYLRVGPGGTFENRRSPATYLNAERDGDVAVPPVADAGAPPEWVRVDDRPRAVWHDHRTHWMSPEPPRLSREDARSAHRLHAWEVPVVVDGVAHTLEGELWWLPSRTPWPWLGAAALLVAPALVGLARRRPSGSTADARRARLRPAALVVGLVALANAAHVPDEVLAQPAPLLDVLFGLLHTGLFVGTGLAGAVIAWRSRGAARAALAVASGAVLFHQGLLHLPALTAAVLPTALPEHGYRLLVATSLIQVVPVVAVLAALRQRALTSGGTEVPAEKGPSTPRDAAANV